MINRTFYFKKSKFSGILPFLRLGVKADSPFWLFGLGFKYTRGLAVTRKSSRDDLLYSFRWGDEPQIKYYDVTTRSNHLVVNLLFVELDFLFTFSKVSE